MRVLDRLTALAVTVGLVLAGLGASRGDESRPAPVAVLAGATAEPVATAGPSAGRPAVAPGDLPGGLIAAPCGDHTAGALPADGPDDPVLGQSTQASPTRPATAAAPGRYRPPTAPLPPGGRLPSRAPPAFA